MPPHDGDPTTPTPTTRSMFGAIAMLAIEPVQFSMRLTTGLSPHEIASGTRYGNEGLNVHYVWPRGLEDGLPELIATTEGVTQARYQEMADEFEKTRRIAINWQQGDSLLIISWQPGTLAQVRIFSRKDVIPAIANIEDPDIEAFMRQLFITCRRLEKDPTAPLRLGQKKAAAA